MSLARPLAGELELRENRPCPLLSPPHLHADGCLQPIRPHYRRDHFRALGQLDMGQDDRDELVVPGRMSSTNDDQRTDDTRPRTTEPLHIPETSRTANPREIRDPAT